MQISNTLAGMITTLPLLAFAFCSPFAPKLGQKFGVELTLLISIIFLTIGIIIRSLSGMATLYIGTAIIGLAIAVCNVLLPSLMKRDFPDELANDRCLCHFYELFGAIASGMCVPIAIGLGYGWQGALGIWGILSFLIHFILVT